MSIGSATVDGKDVPLMPTRLQDLAWLGVDAESIKRLEPFVWIAPQGTPSLPVNVNTAPPEVIAAVLHINRGPAERLIQARRSPFLQDADTMWKAVDERPNNDVNVSFHSSYFIVSGRVRISGRVLEQRSLVKRDIPPLALKVTTKTRESFSSSDPN